MTSLASHLYFSTTSGGAKFQAAMGTLKVFILLSFPKFSALKRKPLDDRSPYFEKRLILLLPCGQIPGKHPKQSPNIEQIGNKNQRPEKQLGKQGNDQTYDQRGNRKLVGTIAPHHPVLQLL